jgi:RNA polymerase sigma-70 factor, ECF subfamily
MPERECPRGYLFTDFPESLALYFSTQGQTMSAKRQSLIGGLSVRPVLAQVALDFTSSLYDQLHRLAQAKMRFERRQITLQPTALVNEAYIRLAGYNKFSGWQDRSRVLGVAAHMMRNILVDHARARSAEKRGAGAIQVTLDSALAAPTGSPIDVLALDEALSRLAAFDQRQAAILELHFFGGLTFEEIALHLGVSDRTVKREWTMARAWMHEQLAH